MSAKPSTVRRIGVGLVLAGAALVSSACAAGQHAATSNAQATQDGVNGDIGKIALRAVALEAPAGAPAYNAGADVALKIVIINNSGALDSLIGIQTAAAKSWEVFTSLGDAQVVLDANAAAASSSAAPSTSPSSASSSSAAALPTGSTSVDIPPGESVGYGTPTNKGAILLEGLTSVLYPAQTVPVTFTFKTAGSVTLQVPVQITGSA